MPANEALGVKVYVPVADRLPAVPAIAAPPLGVTVNVADEVSMDWSNVAETAEVT